MADLADPAWLETVQAATEGLDIGLAVANAAASFVGSFLEQPAASRSATVQVNCLATTELAAWALPPMVARGRGGFVVTSSGSALAGTGAVATYSASKAFVLNLAEAIGWELTGTGVHCQAVVAPAMDTPGWRSHPIDASRMYQPPADPRAVVDGALDRLPDGGWYLADPGLELVAGMARAERVELLSGTTAALYPDRYPTQRD
ncbi:MAG: SDR family NAD(P)-dependent oxidoreductase [Acidimicrobiales bacterium]